MYDELIKALRNCTNPDKCCEDCGFFDKCYKSTEHFSIKEQAADAIEELQAVVDGLTSQTNMVFEKTGGRTVIKFEPKWIPVAERLPEEYEYVLCKTDYGMEVGYHRDEWGQDEWTTGKFGDGTIDVSHWMPLPKAPESDGKT